LKKLIKAEQAKPADQQNYTNIKKALTVIADSNDAGKAARYSKLAIKQINGFELAMIITKEVQLQNEELKKSQAGIDQARATRLAQVEALGKYAIIGKFQTSNIFGSGPVKRYRIIDDKGKTVCYASPTGPIAKKDLSKLAGSKVGLIGKIEASPQISGALVRFTEWDPILSGVNGTQNRVPDSYILLRTPFARTGKGKSISGFTGDRGNIVLGSCHGAFLEVCRAWCQSQFVPGRLFILHHI
jgi:hypothetical protein